MQKNKKSPGFVAQVKEFVVLLIIVFLIRTFGFGLYQVPTCSMETTMLVGERFFADKLSYNFRDPQRGEVISFNAPDFQYSDNKIVKLWEKYVWGPSNWTKRVIAVPGDHIRGAIEDGKPVVYLNGNKLDELYLNAYPILMVWTQDPEQIKQRLDQEIKKYYGSLDDQAAREALVQQVLSQYITPKSYDPAVPFAAQPFYRIAPQQVLYDAEGNMDLRWPGTPHNARSSVKQPSAHRYWDGSDEFELTLGADEYWGMGDNRQGSHDCRAWGPIKREWIHGRILFRIWSVDSDESWAVLDLIKHPIDFFKRVRWSRFFQWIK